MGCIMHKLALLFLFLFLLSGCGGATTTFINISSQIGRDICQSGTPNRFVCPMADEVADEAIKCIAIGKKLRTSRGYTFTGSFKGSCGGRTLKEGFLLKKAAIERLPMSK